MPTTATPTTTTTATNSAAALADRTAEQVQDFTRRSLDRVLEASATLRDQAQRASDRTKGWIQDEPMKAVLVAAAAGAVTALLVRALSGRNKD